MSTILPDDNCQKCIDRVAWFAIWSNALMALLQGTVGLLTGSTASLAIAMQTVRDIIGAGSILVAQKFSKKPQDDEFPYGYGKAEYIASGFTCLLFVLVTLFVSHMAVQSLLRPAVTYDFTPFLLAIFSVIANELQFQYMRCVGAKAKSQSILANAWSNRMDSYAAAIMAVCALGAWMGLPRLDAVAALLIIIFVFRSMFQVVVDTLRGLMDLSMNPNYREKLMTIAKSVVGVHGVRNVRTRMVGRKVWAELEIVVDKDCTIQEGQRIAQVVKESLMVRIEDLEDALVNYRPLMGHG